MFGFSSHSLISIDMHAQHQLITIVFTECGLHNAYLHSFLKLTFTGYISSIPIITAAYERSWGVYTSGIMIKYTWSGETFIDI